MSNKVQDNIVNDVQDLDTKLGKVSDQLDKLEREVGISDKDTKSDIPTKSSSTNQVIEEVSSSADKLYDSDSSNHNKVSLKSDSDADIMKEYEDSINSGDNPEYEAFDELKDVFEYLDNTKRTQTPSQEFYLLFSEYYSNPRMKLPVQVRMLTVAEDKQILSCDDTQDRFLKAIQLSIVDQNGKSFSRKELEELYVVEVEYLYLRYRIHNLSQYHNMNYNCNHCNHYIETKVDLTQLEVNRPSSRDDFSGRFKLPVSKLVVGTEIPKVRDQIKVTKYIKDMEVRMHKTFNALERMVETNITEKALSIKSINNMDTTNSIETNRLILDKLPANDLIVLNKRYEKYGDLGVVFEVERECPACHRTHIVQIPFSWELFRPTL